MLLSRRVWLTSTAVSISHLLVGRLSAQSPRKTIKTARLPDDGLASVSETEVSLELLSGAAAAAEHAQAWGQRLQKLNIPFQTRQAVTGDKAEVKEQKLGRLRRVTVVAVLDRNGKIVCQDRSFTLAEAEKLAEWIRELKAYGAQGAPQGKPLFGLDERQFGGLLRELSTPVEIDTEGLTLEAALTKLPLPAKHPLRTSVEAQRAIRELAADKTLKNDTRGLSVGTALAVLLSECGLIFKPLRTPEGKIELIVAPREENQEAWPIGWPLDSDTSRAKLIPSLFKTVPVALDDVPLTDVLTAASKTSEVPLLIDHQAIERAEINLAELRVTVPNQKTTWSLLLRRVTFPHRLGRSIMADDSGKPFVLITTLKETQKEAPAGKLPAK